MAWPILISKDDIYADSAKQVLLLKQGTEIPSEILPKLISCGVDPAQFSLKEPLTEELRTELPAMDDHSWQSLRQIRSLALSEKHVVALDVQQKSLQRTITTLTRVGFNLGKIHPLRMPQYLGWTLDKYQPSILVIDYELNSNYTALEILDNLVDDQVESLQSLEQVIMTIPVGAVPHEAYQPEEYQRFMRTVEKLNVAILFKPVLPKPLENLLQIDTVLQFDAPIPTLTSSP